MEEPLTMKKLEELLADSQIKAQFYNFGWGLFSIYFSTYKKYGNFNDPTDGTGRRFDDFKEVAEDIDYINSRNGGRALLERWFSDNKGYLNRKLFGRHAERVNYLEKRLIENRFLRDFVLNELTAEFLGFVAIGSDGELYTKYGFDTYKDERSVIFPAYLEALEAVYRLYILKNVI